MSRLKIPDVSWRACRLSAAFLLAALMAATFLVKPAAAEPAAKPGPSDSPAARAHQPMRMKPLSLILDLQYRAVLDALKQQAAPRPTVPQRTAAPSKAPTTPRATTPKRKAAPQRPAKQVSRQAPARRAAPRLAATVSGAKTHARSKLSTAQYQCLDNLIRRESGWNHRAANPSSGAYGLMQALPGSKMASAGSDWRTNPLTQIKWGLKYIKQRYGTPCGAWNFWQKNGWY
ncbi:transglycosylase SLT domain-containing protein [Streptomyces sp. NBC_01760]|uniref:aggregation-promoting factor C-terminal-like domain-containing protein n=1 Tax=Streptomyces sp. NBC_01760 TaxID=2975931 RepID=UPI002DDC061A|nr:transglycosylase SLT domain-containing protein [Streptomyces sp. NBC_01760]WSC72108.1 lytic transglycosylase domain-containing protein [Streptomyces sp. NBC_01760]